MYKKINIIVLFLLISMISGCDSESEKISLATESSENIPETDSISIDEDIYVYIHGQVKTPGVYTLKQGSRLFSAIKMAGGFTKKAQKDYLNLAEQMQDGQSVYVMSKKEYQNVKEIPSTDKDLEDNNSTKEDTININTANLQELMNLPGIGQTKASAIIEYREKNGDFTNTTDIKNVSGIGEATFSNIENMITVG